MPARIPTHVDISYTLLQRLLSVSCNIAQIYDEIPLRPLLGPTRLSRLDPFSPSELLTRPAADESVALDRSCDAKVNAALLLDMFSPFELRTPGCRRCRRVTVALDRCDAEVNAALRLRRIAALARLRR